MPAVEEGSLRIFVKPTTLPLFLSHDGIHPSALILHRATTDFNPRRDVLDIFSVFVIITRAFVGWWNGIT